MATRYSSLYTLSGNGRDYTTTFAAPNNRRMGDPVWLRAALTLPAGTAAADVGILAPLVAGTRLVGGIISATAVNGSLTSTLGYTSSPSAISAALGAVIQSATQTALTPAQITAITVLPVSTDNLIITFGGTFTNPTVLTFLLEFVNVGS